MAAELMPQLTNTQLSSWARGLRQGGAWSQRNALGSIANVTPGVAWKRLIDLTQVDVIRTV